MTEDRFPHFSDMDFIPDDAYPIEDSGAYANLSDKEYELVQG